MAQSEYDSKYQGVNFQERPGGNSWMLPRRCGCFCFVSRSRCARSARGREGLRTACGTPQYMSPAARLLTEYGFLFEASARHRRCSTAAHVRLLICGLLVSSRALAALLALTSSPALQEVKVRMPFRKLTLLHAESRPAAGLPGLCKLIL